ncbi:MAG: inorganic phosphate transporter [Bacteroidetes bacterium]|nr:inorganic phosphate transporter [Bacteroidota bacterium]
MLTIVIICVVIALLFDFLNGMNDAANSIATIVSTKVLSPLVAVAWAAFFNFAAVFIFGVHVAETVGKGIVRPDIVNEYFILAALIAAVIWVYSCTHFGLPISVSHSLIGGMIGPALLVGGSKYLVATGIIKVVAFIVLSPLIGMITAYLIMALTMFLFRKRSPRKVDSLFRVLQLASSAVFSIGHGSNDAQKTMGIIAVLLFSTGYLGDTFYVPTWVIFAAYTAIALGTLTGGWRVIKTLGVGLTDLKPVQGFCAETAGALTVIGNSIAGIPVSTTHTITGSIIGVGLTRRVTAIRWGIASHIVWAWVLTLPATILLSLFFYWIIRFFI